MTSSTSWLVSFTLALNRAWILEKSLPCCLVRSPMTLSMSSWEVTKTHDCPLHLVLRDSAIVWRFSMSFTSSAMNCPTSSTKKLSRKPGSCLSIHAFTEVAKSSIETAYDFWYWAMMPGLASPLTSANALSML